MSKFAPSYVLEYLLGRHCASDDEIEIALGIEAVKDTLRRNYFRHDESNKAQSMVEQQGSHRFIDRVEVRYLPSETKHWAALDNFNYNRIHIPEEFYRRYDRLLEGGIWAIVDVEFRPPLDGKRDSPFHIADLRPIQLARFDFDEYAEGRRRVKEQLKKRGSFEFFKTSFSYIDIETTVERTVGVPEQGGASAFPPDPQPPGVVYTVGTDDEAHVGLFRLEVTVTAGAGKLRIPSALDPALKESLNRAFAYLQSVKTRLGIEPLLAQKDIYAEAVDLSGGRIACPTGIAFYVAMISALQERRVEGGTVVLGDLTIQGNVRGVTSLLELLSIAMENGALRALVPMANKTQFAGLAEEILEKVDIVFYGDAERAVAKALEL